MKEDERDPASRALTLALARPATAKEKEMFRRLPVEAGGQLRRRGRETPGAGGPVPDAAEL